MKSPYLKCGEDHSVSGYLHYIGTRERVELLPDDRPPTRKQEQFITKLVKYFPNVKELNEFSGYETKPTKANASSLITRALEENWSALQKTEGYMKYIATRERWRTFRTTAHPKAGTARRQTTERLPGQQNAL